MLTLVLVLSAIAEEASWASEAYLRPQGGVSAWAGTGGGTSTALNVGAVAGMYYWQNESRSPILQGQARASGAKVFGSGVTGTDLHIGNFIGPSWSSLMLQTGPDFFWNEYQFGATTLAPTLGLGWPLTASTGLGAVSVNAGVEPAWFISSQRPSVDWDSQSVPGFGDEFTYTVGGGVSIDPARLSLSYRYTVTAFGAQKGLGVGLKIGR
ncbi:MAG: hypothetical protein ACI8RZ_000251 [Myxococcota bacterium]|jgi:hypothetical protein